jgi:hypothetical protein
VTAGLGVVHRTSRPVLPGGRAPVLERHDGDDRLPGPHTLARPHGDAQSRLHREDQVDLRAEANHADPLANADMLALPNKGRDLAD